jgi:hypothetical protein
MVREVVVAVPSLVLVFAAVLVQLLFLFGPVVAVAEQPHPHAVVAVDLAAPHCVVRGTVAVVPQECGLIKQCLGVNVSV